MENTGIHEWTGTVGEESAGPLRFERRQADRWPIDGAATVFELAGNGFGRTHALRMCDYSMAGMGAFSETVIPLGTSISVGFQAPGYPARRGFISRCLPCGDGYRIAIAFENRLAA